MQVKTEQVIRVWRIENDTGIGPYQDRENDDVLDITSYHSKESGHPAPQDDRGINRAPRHFEISCFLNLKQVNDWFNQDELSQLEKTGYKLKRVIVSKITAIGEKQILAVRYERRSCLL